MEDKNKRLIAIHLPQFHPFKENDEWWGKGFTEWTNVSKARPRYRGHYQPHIPSDLGFYDLRLEESRIAQADLARQYGIYGFCYYHYWFNGHQLMQRPLEDILSTGKPDFPFMLCWANENWSRAWDGGEKDILIKQDYSLEDDREHMSFLCDSYFSDPRYIRVDGKPFFVVYVPKLFPNLKATISVWRDVAKEKGLSLYLGYMTRDEEDFMDCGFDCAVDFQPHVPDSLHVPIFKQILDFKNSNFLFRIVRRLFPNKRNPFNKNFIYSDYIKYMHPYKKTNLKLFPGITPSWDNSPRRRDWFFSLKKSSPSLYGRWLRYILKNFKPYSAQENFIFINAWNEWAEGNHLEPDLKWGRAYLEETIKSVEDSKS